MNLLMVSPHLPNPSWGAGTRSYYLLKALAETYNVSLLSLTDEQTSASLAQEVHLKRLRQVPLRVSLRRKRTQQLTSVIRNRSYLADTYYHKDVQQAINDMIAQDTYDAVIFESVFMAGYCVPEGVMVIIDQHNIEHELLQRTYEQEQAWSRKWFNGWEARKLKPIELARCRNAQGVLVTSEREYFLLKQLVPQCRAAVVPNGVDTHIFDKTDGQQEIAGRIIFTGTMNYYPNIQAVLFFARECWPRIQAQVPEATWQIVGKSPPPEVVQLAQIPGVTVTGAVPDVKPYLATAAVAIAPLLIGSGTRLKILEALAMHKAVVSTSVGCEGLVVETGKHLSVADQAEPFAQAVIDLLHHPEKRVSLGNAGRALVEAEYSWEQCGTSFIHALENWEGIK
ncbi:MAG: glycosyltransferase [Ktedonobacteraceae bacterium]|nr:glycosyltransferase [Ktedonobacteraceae bacterium]